MRSGDGLFEVEPAEKRQSQDRGAAVDKQFRVFDPHQVLLLPPRWTTGCLRTTWPGLSPTWSTTSWT